MDHDSSQAESTGLLQDAADSNHHQDSEIIKTKRVFSPKFLLPIALLGALAMASTSATAFYAYSTLLCRNPSHCDGDETGQYAGLVAATTCISNIVGLAALGSLRKLAMSNRKLGLLLWMICRSLSAVMLLLGVSIQSIYVALSGRIFEGLASDNLLHFILNALYTQSSLKSEISSLISYSLALYMAGISVSPFVSGLLKSFTTSFFIAISLFGVSILYLYVCVPNYEFPTAHTEDARYQIRQCDVTTAGNSDRFASTTSPEGWVHTVLSPFRPFRKHPSHLLIGLSIATYNITQSYMFNALLVRTTLTIGFTGKENGFLISMTHSIAALYIVTNLFLIPRILRFQQARGHFHVLRSERETKKRDLILSHISLAVHSLSLSALGLSTQEKQIYIFTAFLAVGLPTPSFIKAYFISFFDGEDRSTALASLAMMETIGSVAGPIVLGGLQSLFPTNGCVFFAASGLGVASIVFLCAGSLLMDEQTT